MQRNFTLSLLGIATFFSWGLQAQQTVVLPAGSAGGPAVITNYATTGPGLPTSSLFENRLAQPLGVPTISAPGGLRPAPAYIPREAATIPGNNSLLDVPLRNGEFVPDATRPAYTLPAYEDGIVPTSRYRNACRDNLNAPGFADVPPYTFPGLVTRFAGNWVGSEYLYNMPPEIGVVVDVVAPDRFPLRVDQVRIRDTVSEIFASHNINPTSHSVGDVPPLPFFHVLIFIQNAEEGSVAFVSGRLFENARFLRLEYPLPGTTQAITWEQQDLLVDSINRIENQIIVSAQNIARSFADNVAQFERHKLEQEDMMRMRCANFDLRTPSARGPLASLPARAANQAVGPAGRLGGAPRALPGASSSKTTMTGSH